MKNKLAYNEAIRAAIYHLLKKDKNFHVLGQGVTSPWYAGGSLLNLNKEFPKRVLETPISENLITGMGAGASMLGVNCLIFHPRMDFMLYACDSIINQIAKWNYVTGGEVNLPVTIRGVINRGGSQGAQHSQALHAWFAHVPGLRVVMPSSVADARDLLIAAVLCKDPVIYIDDRWLYEQEEELPPVKELDLKSEKPKIVFEGNDITIISSGFSSLQVKLAVKKLKEENIYPETFDVRVLNPLYINDIVKSVIKTKKFLVVDPGWLSSGFSAELVAKIVENLEIDSLSIPPMRIALPDSAAPTSRILEKNYYTSVDDIVKKVKEALK